MFEGEAEGETQRSKDRESKRWVYILMTSVTAAAESSKGSWADRSRGLQLPIPSNNFRLTARLRLEWILISLTKW